MKRGAGVKKTGTDTQKKKTGRPKGSKSGYTMSEKALAHRVEELNKINSIHNTPAVGEEKVYNAQQIQHVIKIHEIASHANRKDINTMRECFFNYLALCQQDGMKVGNLGAYAAMGLTRDGFGWWLRHGTEEQRELCRMVQSTCALIRENLVADQKINPVIGIFWQRNFDGLRNDVEQAEAPSLVGEEGGKTAAEYRAKYGDLSEE